MAEREKLIEEIKGLQKNQSTFSLKEIDEEIRKRNESPYTEITDYADIPQGNARSEAIEAYLASPQFRRLALEILGGVAGAATGGTFFAARAALRPALGLLYRSLGAGIGEGAAAGAAQMFDPRDDLAKEILRGFATGATAETIGAAIPAMISKIGFKGVKYTDDAEKAETLLSQVKGEQLAKGTSKIDDIKDGLITPGIGSDNRAIDILENITEKSLFAGGKIIRARKGAETALTNELNMFVDNFSDAATQTNAGELALSAVQNSLDYFRGTAKIKYAKVDKLIKEGAAEVTSKTTGKTVSTVPVSVNIRTSINKAKDLIKETKIFNKLEPEAQRVLQTLAALDNKPFLSFAEANGLRSRLLSVTRGSTELIKGQSERYAAILVKELTDNIDKTVDAVSASTSTGLRSAFDSAQRFYRLGVKKYNNKVLKRLTEKAPEEVYKTIIKPKRPSTIKAFRKSIDSIKDKEVRNELMSSIKGTMIGDIVGESNRLKDKIDANYILKEFNKYGDETLLQIFSKNELNNMRGLLESLKIAQKKSVGEGVPGAIFVQLGQASGAVGLFSGVLTAPSAAILFGPAVIGQLFTNPKFIKFIRKGFRLKPGSKEAYTNASQLIGAMISNNLISRDEGEDYLEEIKKSREEDIRGEIKKEPISQIPFTQNEDVDNLLADIETMPTQATSPKVSSIAPITPPVNTGIMQVNTPLSQTGLTSTEQALLSPEEQSVRLRQRGMA